MGIRRNMWTRMGCLGGRVNQLMIPNDTHSHDHSCDHGSHHDHCDGSFLPFKRFVLLECFNSFFKLA